MRMLVTLEFAEGSHSLLIVGRGAKDLQAGDIGLSLDEAKTLISAIQAEFVSAQAAEILEARRHCSDCKEKLHIMIFWSQRPTYCPMCISPNADLRTGESRFARTSAPDSC